MREPELETPLGREAWALYQEEIAPRIKDIDGPMGYAIKGMMMGIESQLPDFFEALDQDQELQGRVIARLETALRRMTKKTQAPPPIDAGEEKQDAEAGATMVADGPEESESGPAV